MKRLGIGHLILAERLGIWKGWQTVFNKCHKKGCFHDKTIEFGYIEI